MTTGDVVVTGTQAAPAAVVVPSGAGQLAPVQAPAAEPAGASFTAEQQAAVDKIVEGRLSRARDKWKAESEAKAQADAAAAEAERQAAQGEWEKLAKSSEAKVTELTGQNQDMAARLERADAVVASLLESRKAGLPESMLGVLEGRDIYDQLALVNAFHEAMPAGPAAANGNGQGRASTAPTPAAQGPRGLTDEERRARAARTW